MASRPRWQEWFKLIDTSHSGQITVRKLLIAMLKHQASDFCRSARDLRGFSRVRSSKRWS